MATQLTAQKPDSYANGISTTNGYSNKNKLNRPSYGLYGRLGARQRNQNMQIYRISFVTTATAVMQPLPPPPIKKME